MEILKLARKAQGQMRELIVELDSLETGAGMLALGELESQNQKLNCINSTTNGIVLSSIQ